MKNINKKKIDQSMLLVYQTRSFKFKNFALPYCEGNKYADGFNEVVTVVPIFQSF